MRRRIGSGGTGFVYEASRGEHLVAVKILDPRWSDDAMLCRRFEDEARIMSRLRHPGIVGVFESGCFRRTRYIVMEYIAGPSLGQCIRRRAFTPYDMAVLAARVARALDYAHRQGVVHSDIVPGNILLNSAGEPKLTDFGLARDRGRAPEGLRPGVTAGTPFYMSPEQASGLNEMIDGRTDVYSLGAVLYEGVTGEPPFSGEDVAEILYKVRKVVPPPPRRRQPRLNVDLERIILRAMEKSPEERYPSMIAFVQALENWIHVASEWEQEGF